MRTRQSSYALPSKTRVAMSHFDDKIKTLIDHFREFFCGFPIRRYVWVQVSKKDAIFTILLYPFSVIGRK